MSQPTQTIQSFDCPDCDFTSSSQVGLCCHRTKIHKTTNASVKSISVVRSYPKGKSFTCCLCGNNFANFRGLKRHFTINHPDILLVATGHCSICNKDFLNAHAASVHCHRSHGISKQKPNTHSNSSPTPIMSHVTNDHDVTSTVSKDDFSVPGPRRSTRLIHKKCLPAREKTNRSIAAFSVSVSQPATPVNQLTSDELISISNHRLPSQEIDDPFSLEEPVLLTHSDVSDLTSPHSTPVPHKPVPLPPSICPPTNIYNDNSADFTPSTSIQSQSNSEALLEYQNSAADLDRSSQQHISSPLNDLISHPLISRFIHECRNLSPSVPQRAPQSVGLPSSPSYTSDLPFHQTVITEPSRFSSPAPGPSPRRYLPDRHHRTRPYQRPLTSDFFTPRWSPEHHRRPSSVVQSEVDDPLSNSTSHPSNDGVISASTASELLIPPSSPSCADNSDTLRNSGLARECCPPDNDPLPSNPDDNSTPYQTSPSSTPSDLPLKKEAFRQKWTNAFSGDIPWSEFCNLCDEFAVESRSFALEIAEHSPSSIRRPKPLPRHDRPSGRRPTFRHRPLLSNPAEAQRIQSLYRHSKKRAARKILSPDNPCYTGSTDSAESFFKNTFSVRNCDITSLQDKLNKLITPAPSDDYLFSSPSNIEIRRKLFSAANTSPGPDRVEYRHLKSVDPSCSILSLLFEHCFKKRDVPPTWKSAITVLIYKKGCTDDPSNFRPIALMSCLYKIVMGIIAKRLTSWAISHDVLSKEQKSARPSEGCYEHTFLLQSIIGEARRSRKNVFVAWLDLRNAFGSIPHSAITTTLSHIGVPLPLIEMIRNSYSGSTTQIRTPSSLTSNIPVLSGVKQGCPLSPIIFNLSIDIILRAIKQKASEIGLTKIHGTPISVLAYADDLVVISRNKDRLQKLLDAASSTATILGLSFRPDKCASISLTCSNHSQSSFELNEFIVQDNPIPPLDREHPYKYLGVPIGLIHNPDNISDLVQDLSRDLDSIEKSLLAPWQKLDMIRTFLQPALTFALRAGFPKKDHLMEYRTLLVATVRRICALPSSSSVSYIFAHKRAGGLGLLDPLLEADIQAIIHAIKILSCSDPILTEIANAELNQTVRFAARANPTPTLKSKYLSSLPDDRLKNMRYNVQSLWTRARKSSRKLGIEIKFNGNGLPILSAENSAPVLAKEASRFLHFHVQDRFASTLLALRDQGKVARSLTTDTFANGSTWHYNGVNIRFRDWRFIHRARLNCLPVNHVKNRWSNSSPKCRRCSSDETLPHVLCHCLPNMKSILRRHNRIVDRIVNAVKHGSVTTDKSIQGSNCRLRPDIIIEENNKVLIIDVCCPFDNDAEALRNAELTKTNKYEELKQFFIAEGKQCEVFGFVIGALGSWHPANENVLRHIGMSKRYRSLFRKLCCTDTIQGSTDIYREHLGVPEG